MIKKDIKNKRVFLKVYAELNLGDDLFLKIILERYPEVTFIILANKELYNVFGNKYQNLVVVDRLENITIFDRLMLKLSKFGCLKIRERLLSKFYYKQHISFWGNVDCFVALGGSMFIEDLDDVLMKNVVYYERINKSLISKPKFFLGCNFGPYKSIKFVDRFLGIFQNSIDVSFRDKSSGDVFLGLENVRVNPDIVFSVSECATVKEANSVGFVLIDPRKKISASFVYSVYLNDLCKVIIELFNRGKKIYFFSFCKSENDEGVISDLLSLLPYEIQKRVEIVKYTGNIDEFLLQYGRVEKMVCGRFHSIILSLIYQQDIIPISYSKKINNMLEDINYNGNIINCLDLTPILDEQSWNFYNSVELGLLNVQSGLHFEKLDSFLK